MPRFRTVDDFLVWEREQPGRWEWYGGEPLEMSGSTIGHGTISGNLLFSLRRSRARVHAPGPKVMAGNTVLYPDLVATFTRAPDESDIVPDPIVIAEIMSPATSWDDQNGKRALYRLIPTLQHYVVVDQSALSVQLDRRASAGWDVEKITGRRGEVMLPALGLSLPLATIYEDTDLQRNAG